MVVGEGVSVAPSRVYLKYYTLLGYENQYESVFIKEIGQLVSSHSRKNVIVK